MTSKDVESMLYKTWLKLLKASVKHKTNKINKLENRLIQLELEKRYEKS